LCELQLAPICVVGSVDAHELARRLVFAGDDPV